MTDIFLKVLNMSISAGWIVLAIVALRLLLKKAPKWITVALWGIVAVRLLCPFSIESMLSMIPSAETVSPSIMTDEVPAISSGIPIINSTVNPVIGESFAPAPGASVNPLQIWIPILAVIWMAGMAAMLLYTAVSYWRLKRKIGTAVLLRGNIFQSENVVSPFVLGVLKPKIYLPFQINGQDMSHVIAHEEAHIARKDHLWKPLGFLLLALHWFNPLMWLGYVLLCRDIELACDEKVIKRLDMQEKADYSQALLACSVNRRIIAACPLAFGEVGVKERVKTVLKYKKAALWVTVVAVVLCVFFAACTLTDPKTENPAPTDPELEKWQVILMEEYPEYFGLDASNGLDVYVFQLAENEYEFALLPHCEASSKEIDAKLIKVEEVPAYTMRSILSFYPIDRDKIYIVPWEDPIVPSYRGAYWTRKAGESEEEFAERQADYREEIRFLLLDFDTEFPGSHYCDSITVDIDGDGKKEMCLITEEGIAGNFPFYRFLAKERGEKKWKYDSGIVQAWRKDNGYIDYRSMIFVEDALGRMYIEAQCQDGDLSETRRIDIAFAEGRAQFFYKGKALLGGKPETTLMFAEPSLSWVASDVPEVVLSNRILYRYRGVQTLGATLEITLTQEMLQPLFNGYDGQYSELAENILRNNFRAFEIYPEDPESVDLYYFLLQKDGSRILVYGHYENGEKNGFIRWIFKTE